MEDKNFSHELADHVLADEALGAFPVEPYLTTSRGVLFRADCIDVMRLMKDESVDSVFADPPFNLGKKYGNGRSDELDTDEYLDWCYQWISEAIRVLVPGGSVFIYNTPKWLMYLGVYLNRSGMLFRHWIAMTMKNTFPRGERLYPAHYGMLYYTKGQPRVFNKLRTPISICRHCGKEIKDYGGYRNKLNDKGLNLTDFWDDTSPVRHKKYKYRVANELKPMISERAILMSSAPGDIVFDPFGGGGSTYQMAEKHDRLWIGTEIAPCEPIAERLVSTENALVGDMSPDRICSVFTHR